MYQPPRKKGESTSRGNPGWETGSEKGYPWLFFYGGHAWGISLLVTVIIIAAGISIFVWYCQFGNDVAPDSMAGYGYAFAGTICFVLATSLYTLRRHGAHRSHNSLRSPGQLNVSLNWHSCFAIMGIAFILMHSFGNFNAKTGTYSLYGLVALTVSGFVGRVIDHIMPRLIAIEVNKLLTEQGEDRIETITRNLPVAVEAIIHDALVAEIQFAQRATQREQFYHYVIRCWRFLHLALALLTIGLIIWHLVYVVQLLIPVLLHHASVGAIIHDACAGDSNNGRCMLKVDGFPAHIPD